VAAWLPHPSAQIRTPLNKLGERDDFLRIVISLYLFVEHDLFPKTGIHPRVKPEGKLFGIML
jgi:hypothetical protein